MATRRKAPKTADAPKIANQSRAAQAIAATPTPISDGLIASVRSLAEVLAEHALSELIVDLPEATVTLRRGAAPMAVPLSMPMSMPAVHAGSPATSGAAAAPPAAVGAAAESADHEDAHLVTSPFVGTFYRRPNPDSPSYVEVNERVDRGQVLCIVEAMKLMNEIEADVAGTVIGILAEDGAPVEYGQPLFKIAPA
jgi:acetyl-CoA carboxylase biotin carboxyl carrier protein